MDKETPTTLLPLEIAIRCLGSQEAVAEVCRKSNGRDGMTQQAVSYWLKTLDGTVPADVAPYIATACRSKCPDVQLSKETLCPSFPWAEIA